MTPPIGGTTLVEELDEAADALEAYALTLGAQGSREGYLDMRKDAARLRERARVVREALAPFEGATWTSPRLRDLLDAAGPLPEGERGGLP